MKTIRQYTDYVNECLSRLIPINCVPPSLTEPIDYTIALGGKRLRPVLLLATVEALGGDCVKGRQTAVAIELFHNFTLLHDDIMDRSDMRRGYPTVFTKWGESQAILSGDAMLTIACQTLMANREVSLECRCRLMDQFNIIAMDVYRGQQYDMEFETRDDVSVSEYISMIGLKTGALLGGSCRLGAITMTDDAAVQKAFYDYGYNLGIAFQLQDDLLDSFGNSETFGKPIGGDILNDKKTWLNITARTEAADLMANAGQYSAGDKVTKVKDIYVSLNLPSRCETLINEYFSKAIDSLYKIPMAEGFNEFFTDFAHSLMGRKK